jgi:carbon monoxide dehydrogenase subunit G
MATTTVLRTTPASPDEAFDFIADFTTSQRWDPGIAAATRLDDGPVGLGSRFEVRYRAGLVTLPLVYEITRYERPDHLVLSTRGLTHHGEDDVRVEATDEGTRIVWKATFGLRGPGRLLEPLVRRTFPQVASKAGDGLQACLREVSRPG